MLFARAKAWVKESKDLRREAAFVLQKAVELEGSLLEKKKALSVRMMNVKYYSEELEKQNKELLEMLRDVKEARMLLRDSLKDLGLLAFLRAKHVLPSLASGACMAVILAKSQDGGSSFELSLPSLMASGLTSAVVYLSSVASLPGSLDDVKASLEGCRKVISKVEAMLDE